MTKKFSFFIVLSLASMVFLFSMTSRAKAESFLTHEQIVSQLGSYQNRTPSSVGLSLLNTEVDMRAYDAPVTSQFGGTCSTFATAAVMNNILKKNGISKQVSHRDLWNRYGVYDADVAISAASKNYITDIEHYPDYGGAKPDYQDHRSMKITSSTQHAYQFEAALRALDKNNPVVMAVQVPSDLSNCKAVVSDQSYRTKGQHVMAAVGYKLDSKVAGGGYFILKNSWGKDCGDKGYHYYSFDLCKRKDLYCYFIEVASVESKP